MDFPAPARIFGISEDVITAQLHHDRLLEKLVGQRKAGAVSRF